MPDPQQLSLCQRWRHGRTRYRPSGERIDPRRYGVDVIEDRVAAAFIAEHHYARTSPPGILSVGLFDTRGLSPGRLVGVCRFSVPMNPAAVPHYTGQPAEAGCELGRLVLEDSVAGNGESFFVARALKRLVAEKPRIRAVISYSDPLERTDELGRVFKKGHVGIVYQALSAHYFGRSSPRAVILAPDGTVLSDRALSKLRNDERGSGYVYRLLRSFGAGPIQPFESGRDYVARVLGDPQFKRVRHPGNHAYAWGVGDARASVERAMPPRLVYPRAIAAPSG
jgi:hypothetical protein